MAISLAKRASAVPWLLHQAESLTEIRATVGPEGFYVGMLKDDLSKLRYAYELSLVPEGRDFSEADDTLSKLLIDFRNTGYGRDPVTRISDFTDVLLDQCTEGNELLLELYALSDDEVASVRSRKASQASDTGSRASLGYIPRWSVLRSRSDVAQLATEADAPAIVIDSQRIRRVRLPDSVWRKWRQTVRDLRQVDRVWRAQGESLDRLYWRGYDFSENQRALERAVAAATAPIGWDARGLIADSFTSPYLTYRRLRFVQFWVEAMESAVAVLNEYTSSPAIQGDEAFTFSIAGLPSGQEIGTAMEDLRAGVLSVDEANDRFLFPRFAARRAQSVVSGAD